MNQSKRVAEIFKQFRNELQAAGFPSTRSYDPLSRIETQISQIIFDFSKKKTSPPQTELPNQAPEETDWLTWRQKRTERNRRRRHRKKEKRNASNFDW